MLTPRVSIIIPAYNAERYLPEAIDSVISQTYPNIECIVVDDGSTDGTAAVATRYGERVILVRQENLKLPGARNSGIRIATGDFLSFLDADDRIAPEKIDHQLAYLLDHPEVGAVYSRVRYFSDSVTGEFYSLKRPTPQGDILPSLVYGNFIPVHSTLMRKEVIDAVGGTFRPFPALEDWDFLLRLSLAGCRFGFLDEELADYRMHPGGMSCDQVLMFQAKLQVIAQVAEEFREALLVRGVSPEAITAYHRADFGKALILGHRAKEGIAAISAAVEHSFPRRGLYVMISVAARLVGTRAIHFMHDLTSRRRKRV